MKLLPQRIKQFRSQKMSLDELARRLAKWAAEMLVEIEGCKANPSIALLCKDRGGNGSVRGDEANASEPMVHLIDRGCYSALWRGEKGGSAKPMAGTSGRIC